MLHKKDLTFQFAAEIPTYFSVVLFITPFKVVLTIYAVLNEIHVFLRHANWNNSSVLMGTVSYLRVVHFLICELNTLCNMYTSTITSEVTVQETRFLLDKLLCALDNLLTVSISLINQNWRTVWSKAETKFPYFSLRFCFPVQLLSLIAQLKQKPSKVFQKLPQRWYQ